MPAKKKTVRVVRVPPSPERKKKVRKIVRVLSKTYPDAECALNFTTPLELLIATILSAQCTDNLVNKVTADLFKKYRKAKDYAAVTPEELQEDIRQIGLFRMKSKNIVACCQALVEEHGGKVPETMEELTALAGTGRKTANVVLGNAFGVPGIVTDTHVIRLSQRLGLTKEKLGDKVEMDLNDLIPKKEWIMFSHRLVSHGRQVCSARNPRCAECVLYQLCEWPEKEDQKRKSEKGG
jgi:endonuclease-3